MGLRLVEKCILSIFASASQVSTSKVSAAIMENKTYCLSHFFGTSNWPKLSSDFSGVHQKGLNLTS